MMKNDFTKLVTALEEKARMPEMRPFQTSQNLECPWLHWFLETINGNGCETPTGLLIMQDWDCEMQSLSKAMGHIRLCVSSTPPPADKTINNLLKSEAWRQAITSGKILVTNAAWGIRPLTRGGGQSRMCGELSARIHKAALLTWGRLVMNFSNSSDFRLFVAGSWGRFSQFRGESEIELRTYMKTWCEWAAKYRGKVQVPLSLSGYSWKGSVVFLRHPCIWHSSVDFERSPFPAPSK